MGFEGYTYKKDGFMKAWQRYLEREIKKCTNDDEVYAVFTRLFTLYKVNKEQAIEYTKGLVAEKGDESDSQG